MKPRFRLYRGFRKLMIWMFAGGVIACAMPDAAEAQDRRDGRRDQVDDLLRSLIETELDRRELRTQDRRDEFRNTSPAVAQPRNLTSPTREMLEARRILSQISSDAGRLYSQLEVQRNVPGVTPNLSDVLKLRARVAVLDQRAQRMNDHRELQEGLRAVDRDWRVVAYRLERIRGLDRRTLALITEINDHSKQLAASFELKPQFDRSAMLRQSVALSTELHNLMDDLKLEVRDVTQQNQLLLTGGRIEQQARLVTDTVASNRSSYDNVVVEYKQFQNMWYPYATRLRPLENRYLERNIRRIQEVDNTIHELLWLPQTMDRQQLLHLTTVMKKEVDNFFLRAPLKLLIELPESELVIPTAHEFYGLVDNFVDGVNRGENIEDLADSYRYITDGWQSFNRVFGRLSSPAAQQVMNEIEQSIIALRDALHIRDGFDGGQAVEVAASLENLAVHLDRDMRNWLDRSRETYRSAALRDSNDFAVITKNIHEMLLTRRDMNQVRGQLADAEQIWRRVRTYTDRAPSSDRYHLQSLTSEITPKLVELRTMIVR